MQVFKAAAHTWRQGKRPAFIVLWLSPLSPSKTLNNNVMSCPNGAIGTHFMTISSPEACVVLHSAEHMKGDGSSFLKKK